MIAAVRQYGHAAETLAGSIKAGFVQTIRGLPRISRAQCRRVEKNTEDINVRLDDIANRAFQLSSPRLILVLANVSVARS